MLYFPTYDEGQIVSSQSDIISTIMLVSTQSYQSTHLFSFDAIDSGFKRWAKYRRRYIIAITNQKQKEVYHRPPVPNVY